MHFYISAYTTLNELLAVFFIYIIHIYYTFIYIIEVEGLKGHWTVTLYTTTTTTTTCRLHHCKISFIYVNWRPRYCCLAATIL